MRLNEITIEVTQQCPNRCIYCSSLSDIEKEEQLDYATICHIVDDAKELGAKSVSLSGGEPFMREDIARVVNYINSNGMEVRLYTSGIYFVNGHYTSIPKQILETVSDKLSCLIFNYESDDKRLYASIMGTEPDNFALLDETIKCAISLGISVETHFVPMHCNYRQIPHILAKLYEMGVSNVSFLRFVPQGRALLNKEQVNLSVEEQKELKQIMTDCRENYKDKIRIGLPFSSNRGTCGTGSIKLTVRYDGYVFPCEAFKDGMMEIEEGIIPDNVKDKTLKIIYNKSLYIQKIRSGLKVFSASRGAEQCYGQYCRQYR